jgi:pimeloyl-ACP methyl ester carboxylesterase
MKSTAADSLAAADQLAAMQSSGCVDLYFQAVLQAEQCIESAMKQSQENPSYQSAWQVYQQGIAKLIETGQRYRRLDPKGRLFIAQGSRWRVIPIAYHGFAWKPSDFCQLLSASEYSNRNLAVNYQSPGLGVALIAVRHASCDEQFYQTLQPFPVTAILHSSRSTLPAPQNLTVSSTGSDPDVVLEFYNPYLFDSVHLGSMVFGLNRDLTAPLEYSTKHESRKYLEGFLDPRDAEVKPKLLFMEPYQHGKIPLVLIHGLYSDPNTWLDAVNELCAQPDIYREYQIWFHRYPTGGAVLESAAKLREQLLVAREIFDPAHKDPALERMVLVGHSMGGLMAQFQVTYSSDILWRQVAKQPLEAVRTTAEMRKRLENDFFFDPLPLVSRVVFIGTPHHGSGMARRLVGRAASSLVQSLGSEEPEYRRLMDENSDIFYEYLQRSPPTSVDLLEPTNPLLEALSRMQYSRSVRLHSIIGTGGSMLAREPGDGVVPVSSAHQTGACSEIFVPVRHEKLHHDAETFAELNRILREHALE